MEPFIGQIQMFGFSFAPRGWALCDGQLLPISQNTALFSLLGTTHGGDGRTTFGLPDLRGRSAIHQGTGPGLPATRIGSKGGANTHTLTTAQMPAHSHSFQLECKGSAGDSDNPRGAFPAQSAEDVYASTKDEKMGASTTGSSGGGQAFDIRDPFLTVNFCIALTGLFPSRS